VCPANQQKSHFGEKCAQVPPGTQEHWGGEICFAGMEGVVRGDQREEAISKALKER
jgi:hypothetical protein